MLILMEALGRLLRWDDSQETIFIVSFLGGCRLGVPCGHRPTFMTQVLHKAFVEYGKSELREQTKERQDRLQEEEPMKQLETPQSHAHQCSARGPGSLLTGVASGVVLSPNERTRVFTGVLLYPAKGFVKDGRYQGLPR
ncbi:hypothetical protein PsorP6_014756 [Peronosclerospora sorghi]|uniref:Uncharacterized protein n=1 Tax=Peronosclerospora sorghi TaxID=230839 RepID=A0ACC0VS44_9STRA|nr:hypothetical protein PsorP6_014756 [Peronosclerospora sorghi]